MKTIVKIFSFCYLIINLSPHTIEKMNNSPINTNSTIDTGLHFDIVRINETASNKLNKFDHFGKEHNLALYDLMFSNADAYSETYNLFEKALKKYSLKKSERLGITGTITKDNYNNDFRNTPLFNKVKSDILKTEIISMLEYFRVGNEIGCFGSIEDVNASIALYEEIMGAKIKEKEELKMFWEFTSTFRHSANYWYNYETLSPSTKTWKWWEFLIVAAADAMGATGGMAVAVSASAVGITLVDNAFLV